MTHQNYLRTLLNGNKPSICTRLWSTWPIYVESLGYTGYYDYMEYVAEYSPFSQMDLENLARAAQLYEMGAMIKVDLQNRFYVAQKAVAAGFEAINFTDHRTAEEVRQSIASVRPLTVGSEGVFGHPNRRFICEPHNVSQLEHIRRLNDIVCCFMIEKQEAVDNIEEICSVPGVDMVQFGPADYSMSLGRNKTENPESWRAVERYVIKVALSHGVQPRCEINSAEEAKYYADLGVRHFSVGDQMKVLRDFWQEQGQKMKTITNSLE